MKDGQLFRIKVIKGVEDLPKENGYYFFKSINTVGNGDGITYYDKFQKERWIDSVDWYLIPEPEITDEDIYAWAKNKEQIFDAMPETLKLHITRKIECRIEGAKAVLNGEIKHIE